MDNIESIFIEKGVLSKNIKNFESRQEQLIMATAIKKAIENENQLLVEAGTGVGKSLAYLIPFVLWAQKFKKKVIISTYTKTLQHQLVEKDLPFLKKILKKTFRFTLCVGVHNYICRRRFDQVKEHDLFETAEEARQAGKITLWANTSSTGLKSELGFEPLNSLWNRISRETDLCLGKKCIYNESCFYADARKKQKDSHLLVVNHHLFFANLATGEKVLPPYDAIVFDEAHNIEEVAANYLGIEVSNYMIKNLADSLYNPKNKKGLLCRIHTGDRKLLEKTMAGVDKVRYGGEQFFREIIEKLRNEKFPFRIKQPHFFYDNFSDSLHSLGQQLKKLKEASENEEHIIEIGAFIKRTNNLKGQLQAIIDQKDPDYVYWVNLEKKSGYERISLNSSSIEISENLSNMLFTNPIPIVLTSATLSTDGTFDYIRERLGLDKPETELLDSPFDYERNSILYIPRDIPDPGKNTEVFESKALERMIDILNITGGRTVILFTSYRFMQKAYNTLIRTFETLHIQKQGDTPQYHMIEDFKKRDKAVILGTNSFWQGIDIPGEALETVIIAKLPFSVPDDPITEARMEFMKSQNIDPFTKYQIPQAIIWLKQGVGRLIRSKEDKGIIAILDTRIITRTYGKRFLNSLPMKKFTSNLDDVSVFYRKLRQTS